jgi:hypothetical protein
MHAYTNLAWPGDPYRASQQLYRRPSAMLAAFAVLPPGRRAVTAPAAVAVVYLPLHRTRPVAVTEDTVTFGFRAASTAEAAGVPSVAQMADLDLMQARRHARFLAGHALAADLSALRDAVPAVAARGLDAVQSGWADRWARAPGMAELIDIRGAYHDLAAICRSTAITASPASMAYGATVGSHSAERLAAAAAERALAIALACARALNRYRWDGVLCAARIMAAAAWDLFPQVMWDEAPYDRPASRQVPVDRPRQR